MIESLEGRRMLDALPLDPPPLERAITSAPGFGSAVATYGDLVLVGQQELENGTGAAKLLDAAGQELALVANPDAQPGDRFGGAVAFIDATRFAVGSTEADNAKPAQVHIFSYDPEKRTIDEVGRVASLDDMDAEAFGNSLASVQGTLLVSAPSGGQDLDGRVYRYEVDRAAPSAPTLYQTYKLAATYSAANSNLAPGASQFGQSMVAYPNGTTMLFSAKDVDFKRAVIELNLGTGATQTYREPTPSTGGSFALGFSAQNVYVGDTNAGTVARFGRSDGKLIASLDDAGAGTGFGSAVAVNGAHVLIGARNAREVVVVDRDFTADTAPIATIEDETPAGRFGSLVRNLDGQRVVVADASDGDGTLYVYDLADMAAHPTEPEPDVRGGIGTDTIFVTQANGSVTVALNGVPIPFGGDRLVIDGGAGNDVIGVALNVAIPVEIYGGDGNDFISGGAGADILVGGDGNDALIGNGGRDLLIGGKGADALLGMASDDILVAGYTRHDAAPVALRAISRGWNVTEIDSAGGTYANRVESLRTDLLRPDADVLDDGAIDILAGNGGSDWFMFDNDGSARDLIVDRSGSEVRTDIDALEQLTAA